MKMSSIFKIGLAAIVASVLSTAQAQVPKPAPKPVKDHLRKRPLI